jgi:Holliday junction resolvase
MGRMQRTKGASGERELANLIHLHLGVRLARNLEQSRRGGHDLIPHPEDTGPVAQELARFAIEVKRHAKATPALLRDWWTQATEQARRAGLVPCLAYREDRQEWRVVLPLSALQPSLEPWEGHEWTADLSLLGFVTLVREAAE